MMVGIAEKPTGFRAEKKLRMMRHVQAVALDLFEEHGFYETTVEEVARAAEISTPTIYRNFSTKENLVLWDEYDPKLYGALREQLALVPPLEAVRKAVTAPLTAIYAEDSKRILRRVRLINSHSELRAATAANRDVMRKELARIFVDCGGCDDFGADVIAGAVVSALRVAVSHWADRHGKIRLSRYIDKAFDRLTRIAAEGRLR